MKMLSLIDSNAAKKHGEVNTAYKKGDILYSIVAHCCVGWYDINCSSPYFYDL
jgi:hypothetical protein